MALLRETGVGGPEEGRLPYPRQNAPVARSIAWKPSNDAYYLLAANLRNSGYEHEIYITQRVLLQIQEHAAGTERDVDGSLWGRIFVSPDSGASYAVIADAIPGTDVDSARTGPQMDGPLRLAGWYCSRPGIDSQPAPEDISTHLERCTGGWEPFIVLTSGAQPHDGSLFLVNPMSGRAFRAPFRELLEPQFVRENAPKRSCIPWRGYVTDEPVVALPIRDRGTARRTPSSDEQRSAVSMIAEGVAADVRAAARVVSRVMGGSGAGSSGGAASRERVSVPSSPAVRRPTMPDEPPPAPAASAAPAWDAEAPTTVEVETERQVAAPPELEPLPEPLPEPVVETVEVAPPEPADTAPAAPMAPMAASPVDEPVDLVAAPPIEEFKPALPPTARMPAAGSLSITQSAPVSMSSPLQTWVSEPPAVDVRSSSARPRETRAAEGAQRTSDAARTGGSLNARLADLPPARDVADLSAPSHRRPIFPPDLAELERHSRPAPRKPIKVDEEKRVVPASVLGVAAVLALLASFALMAVAVQRVRGSRAPIAESQAGALGTSNGSGDATPAASGVKPLAATELPRAQARLVTARTDSLRVALAWYQEIAEDYRAERLGCALVLQARGRLVTTRDSLGSLLATVPEGTRIVEQRSLLVQADKLEREAASMCRNFAR